MSDKLSKEVYDTNFFAAQLPGSARSAAVLVPKILSLFPECKSVVDVGCGTGVWLHQFRLNGVTRTVGIDGGRPSGLLQIDTRDFLDADLRKPFPTNERFDIAICLEVAEHLPAASAEQFISSLCKLSDVVIFGAAIPGQGGTDHLNERWPSYWRALFAEHGYRCSDQLRQQAWFDERVEWWYVQNTLIFYKSDNHRLAEADARLIDVVHPRGFLHIRTYADDFGYGKPSRLPALTEKVADTAASAQRRIWSFFGKKDRPAAKPAAVSSSALPAVSPPPIPQNTVPYFHPSAPLSPATKHLFIEFPILHELLFEVYGELPGTQLILVKPDEWWIGKKQYDFIRLSLGKQLKSIVFMTLDRVLFNPDPKPFLAFASHTQTPIAGILHRLPANAEEHAGLQATKNKVNTVIVLSRELAREAAQLFGDGIKMCAMENVALADTYFQNAADVRAAIGAKPGDFVVSMLGEARKGKGYELLLDSLPFIPERERARLFFLFGGKAAAWRREEVQKRLEKAGCRGFVDIRKSSEALEFRVISDQEMANYVMASDLGLLLYQDEQRRCSSGVLHNYVWGRKPVLATEDSTVGSEVMRYQLGSVLKKETPRSLAARLSEIAGEKAGWAPSAESEKFRTAISHESVLAQLRSILDESSASGK